MAVLQLWEGSDFWAYRSFEIGTKDLYWMFVLPLAGLFEGVRKLFEKASEIRAAQRAKMIRKERARLQKALTKLGHKDPETGAITLTPEAMESVFGKSPDSGA